MTYTNECIKCICDSCICIYIHMKLIRNCVNMYRKIVANLDQLLYVYLLAHEFVDITYKSFLSCDSM